MREWGTNPRDEILARALFEGEVTLVVGAGVSIYAVREGRHNKDYNTKWDELNVDDWEGPTQTSWKGLLLHGVRFGEQTGAYPNAGTELRGLIEADDMLLQVGQILQERLTRAHKWPDWLQAAFGSLGDRVTDEGQRLLDAIGALGAPTLTTNYDRLLTPKPGGSHVHWLSAENPINIIDDKQPDILHIHGDYSSQTSVILGSESYARLGTGGDSDTSESARLRNALSHAYTSRMLVFIGCGLAGLTDPHFKPLRRFLGEVTAGESRFQHYVLCRSADEESLRGSDRIEPLAIGDGFPDLPQYLEEWARQRTTLKTAVATPSDSEPQPTAYAQRVSLRFNDRGAELAAPGRPRIEAEIDWEGMCDWPRRQSMARLTRALAGRSELFECREDYRLLGAHLYWVLGGRMRDALKELTPTVGPNTYLELEFADHEELHSHPWEYIYRFESNDRGLLADGWRFVLRRAIRSFELNRPPRNQPQLDVLCVIADPWQNVSDDSGTDVKHLEWSDTRDVLKALEDPQSPQLKVSYLVGEEAEARHTKIPDDDEDDLAMRLNRARQDRQARHDVVHILAHARTVLDRATGARVPQLAFPALDGTVRWRLAETVARDVAGPIGRWRPSLVLLQLDESAVHDLPAMAAVARAFAAECPNVVAVQQRGDLKALGVYLNALYAALARGESLDVALNDALEAAVGTLQQDDRDRRCPSFGIPIVYLADPSVFAAPREPQPERTGAAAATGQASRPPTTTTDRADQRGPSPADPTQDGLD